MSAPLPRGVRAGYGLGSVATGTFGTVPGLILIGTGASALARKYRRHLDLIAGLLMIWMGLSLTVRALATLGVN